MAADSVSTELEDGQRHAPCAGLPAAPGHSGTSQLNSLQQGAQQLLASRLRSSNFGGCRASAPEQVYCYAGRQAALAWKCAQSNDNYLYCFQVLVQVSLNKVVDHVFDIMGHLVKKKVTLEKNLAPDLPHIIADGSRVVQASCPALAAVSVLSMAIKQHVMPVACANCQHTEHLIFVPGALQSFGKFR